ncbi:hypothetical protein [Pseudoflavonifractor phocaeensis]|uniref:hypothetical protein n=1 Tax=Pseudoflavonifractor phocaeensis TaxID=1870988 RepID=UPI0019568AC7|nr:hypothetical protein [Pseudoflavonifractor phocaeensis]MBM6926106.1 hypothetical protein [Pseudoflavonifractor phocaeensis]
MKAYIKAVLRNELVHLQQYRDTAFGSAVARPEPEKESRHAHMCGCLLLAIFKHEPQNRRPGELSQVSGSV